jgi:phage shock protein A
MAEDETHEATIQALHRRIARLELENGRLERHVEELRAAISALLAPTPERPVSNKEPLPPYGR